MLVYLLVRLGSQSSKVQLECSLLPRHRLVSSTLEGVLEEFPDFYTIE